jgi:hypothetical protein
LDDPGLRERLGQAAARRRPTLRRWDETVAELAAVLDRVAPRTPVGTSSPGRGRPGDAR